MEQRCSVQRNYIKYGKLLFLLPQAPSNLKGEFDSNLIHFISRLLRSDGVMSYFYEGAGGKGFGNF